MEKGGSKLPPPEEYKRMIVKQYAKNYNCEKLIETGTYLGGMIEAQIAAFRNVASIELSKELYQRALTRFDGIESVHLYCGDSSILLGTMIDNEDAFVNTLFWLDGHYSGGETACGEK